MDKNYSFYRCHLERRTASDGEPGLFAATEVVQAVCDAGFQRYETDMRSYPSSPHCYFKYAKTPRDGMFMLKAVKKTDMMPLDILIDTRIYPCFVMIEENTEWKELMGEVTDTLERMINDEAEQYNWHVKMQEFEAKVTQHLKMFISALAYLGDQEDTTEKHNGYIQIGQIGHLILKMNGNNYYNNDIGQESPTEGEEEVSLLNNPDLVEKLKPLFYNNEANVNLFLNQIRGMQPSGITDLVNLWVKDKRISNYGYSRKGELWDILNDAGLYSKSRQNWCRRVY
jgi:hypothetical protein